MGLFPASQPPLDPALPRIQTCYGRSPDEIDVSGTLSPKHGRKATVQALRLLPREIPRYEHLREVFALALDTPKLLTTWRHSAISAAQSALQKVHANSQKPGSLVNLGPHHEAVACDLSAVRVRQLAVRGSWHVITGMPCQDATAILRSPDLIVAVVADGATGAPKSHYGARLLSTNMALLAKKVAQRHPGRVFPTSGFLGDLHCSMVKTFVQDARSLGISPQEAAEVYGTVTLSVMIMDKHNTLITSVGDGFLWFDNCLYDIDDLCAFEKIQANQKGKDEKYSYPPSVAATFLTSQMNPYTTLDTSEVSDEVALKTHRQSLAFVPALFLPTETVLRKGLVVATDGGRDATAETFATLARLFNKDMPPEKLTEIMEHAAVFYSACVRDRLSKQANLSIDDVLRTLLCGYPSVGHSGAISKDAQAILCSQRTEADALDQSIRGLFKGIADWMCRVHGIAAEEDLPYPWDDLGCISVSACPQ